MTIVAKFKVDRVEMEFRVRTLSGESLEEQHVIYMSTQDQNVPNSDIILNVTNPELWDHFKLGGEVTVTIY